MLLRIRKVSITLNLKLETSVTQAMAMARFYSLINYLTFALKNGITSHKTLGRGDHVKCTTGVLINMVPFSHIMAKLQKHTKPSLKSRLQLV